MPKYILISLSCVLACFSHAQKNDSIFVKNGIKNPNLLPIHHFGILSSRISQNFKYRPEENIEIIGDFASGNIFQPFVEGYFPESPEIREQMKKLSLFERPFNFGPQNIIPAEYMNIVVDAVIKEFRLGINIPLGQRHEMSLNMRSYLINKGNYPFSPFTGDETIEWYHSNIYGGEDPFGRRFYGLNQVNFKYTDRTGQVMEFENNDFFIGGIELNYFFYPKLNVNNFFMNFGIHSGLNTSKYNSSVDTGVSINTIKRIPISDKYEMNIALGGNILRKNLIDFKDNIDLGNNPYIGGFETNIEVVKYTKKANFNSISFNYQLQSRYSKKEEATYFKLVGNWEAANGGWHNGVEKLYRTLRNWNIIYTYGTPKFQFSLYFKEDFQVNNAPDFQVGGNLIIPIRAK